MSTTRSCCSYCSRRTGHSGCHKRGSSLRRSPYDGLLLVPCIPPCRFPPDCLRHFFYSSTSTTSARTAKEP